VVLWGSLVRWSLGVRSLGVQSSLGVQWSLGVQSVVLRGSVSGP